ncbi:MAG: hypothetical protein ACRDI0_02600 [Actinomycetota bacterium]
MARAEEVENIPGPPDIRAGGEGPHRRRKRLATRALLVSSLLYAFVGVLPAPAGAAAELPLCSTFSLTQAYRGWGPADRYGHAVTVVYAGTQCSTVGGGSVEVDFTGTATMFKGLTGGGPAIDVRSFEASGTWTKSGILSAWPPPWWSCSVDQAELRWTIPAVYSFAVAAHDGLWTLDVQTWGTDARTVHWEHQACAGV